MINWFNYGDTNSYTDLNMLVQRKDIYTSPAPDITALEIPGRSGDVLIDNNRLKNVDVSYTCAIITKNKEKFAGAARKIRTALLAYSQAYKRLVDSYDANYYRLAAIKKRIDITQHGEYDGTMQVVFTCKPYLYSFAGAQVITITSPQKIINYEKIAALPLIKIYGSGAVTLYCNGAAFAISALDGYIELDSERMTAHKGEINASATVNCQAFPVLQPGENNISWAGSVSRVEITPRWRAL